MVKEVTGSMLLEDSPGHERERAPRRTRPTSLADDDDDDDDDDDASPGHRTKRPARIRRVVTVDPDDPDYSSEEQLSELEALYEESFQDLEEGEIVRGTRARHHGQRSPGRRRLQDPRA